MEKKVARPSGFSSRAGHVIFAALAGINRTKSGSGTTQTN
jgi:hypothetical protein